MAELSKTEVLARARHGDAFEATYRVTCGSNQAAEWITTPFSQVYSAHAVPIGPGNSATAVIPNAKGTGETEGSALGAVGIERLTSGDAFVTVVGR